MLEILSHNENKQKQETELANKEPNIKSKINCKHKRNHNTVNRDVAKKFSDKKHYLKTI